MKHVLIPFLAGVVSLFTFVVSAQGAEEASGATAAASQAGVKRDAADELVQLLHADNLADGPKRMLSLYAKKMADQALKDNPNLTAAQKDNLAKLPVKVGDVVQQNLKWDRLLAAFAQIYRKIYTTEEIQAYLLFYKSKEGQSILSKTARLSNQLALEETVSLRPVYAKLQKVINEQVKTIVSTRPPPNSTASSP
jgi:hypothetical protein